MEEGECRAVPRDSYYTFRFLWDGVDGGLFQHLKVLTKVSDSGAYPNHIHPRGGPGPGMNQETCGLRFCPQL